MINRLDRDIQHFIDLFDEKGVFQNTIIIFTSDNGVHKEGGYELECFNSNVSDRY